MDWLQILFRFVHIFAAIAWAGSAMFVLAVLDPMAKRIGPAETARLNRHLALRSSLSKFFPILAVLTVVGGLVLYFLIGAKDAYPMSSTPGIVFNVGMLFGVLALVWGGSMEGRLNTKMAKAARAYEAKPNPAGEAELTTLQDKLSAATKVSGALILVAIFCMSTFQYFG